MNAENVIYAKLFNLGNCENERIEITLSCGLNDPGHVLKEAKDWVEEQHRVLQEEQEGAEKARDKRDHAEFEVGQLERKIKDLKSEFDHKVFWLKAMGIELPYWLAQNHQTTDDIPF